MENKSSSSLSSSSNDEGWSSESVASSLRDFAESMMRRQVVELEMMKAREAARIEAENRRLERENEFTEMMLKTQLQITSFICHRTIDRKRKRSEDDGGDSQPVSAQREGAMLLSLLQFNLGI